MQEIERPGGKAIAVQIDATAGTTAVVAFAAGPKAACMIGASLMVDCGTDP